jgi:hypothetical protein
VFSWRKCSDLLKPTTVLARSGIRASGDPAALTRLPSEIVEAVEAIWQRSLALAALIKALCSE